MPYRPETPNGVQPSTPTPVLNPPVDMKGWIPADPATQEALRRGLGDIEQPSPSMQRMLPYIKLTKALMGGLPAMRKAGTAYLPMEVGESSASYQVRLGHSHFYNGFKKAVQSNVGRIFSKDVVLDKDVDDEIAKLLDENCDGFGRSYKVFLKDVCEEGLAHTIGWVLTDYPSTNPDVRRTLADEQRNGLRPYWRFLSSEQVLGVDYLMIGGEAVMTKARIRFELSRQRTDVEFGYENVVQIWVLEIGRFRVYEKVDSENEFRQVVDQKTTFNKIHLRPFIPMPDGPFEGVSPLLDLAYLNVRLWQTQSDQNNVLHVGRMAILFASGVEPIRYDPNDPNRIVNGDKQLIFSPKNIIYGPEGSTLQYVEPAGTSIAAGQTDIESIKQEMRSAGMELLVNANEETATARKIDAKSAFSLLQSIAKGFEDFVEIILGDFAEMMRKPRTAGGSVHIDTDWDFDPENTSTYSAAERLYDRGLISKQTLLQMAKKHSILEEDLDIDVEIEKTQMELPEEDDEQPFGR
jgi:hypothetical protein